MGPLNVNYGLRELQPDPIIFDPVSDNHISGMFNGSTPVIVIDSLDREVFNINLQLS